MKDPKLPAEQFVTDRVLFSRSIASPADLAALDGASISGDAVEFASRTKLVLTFHPPASDLSDFNSLALRVLNRSLETLLVGIKLIHGSQSLRSGPSDVSFSGGRESVVPGKWNHVRFPRESFGFYGAPDGWTDVQVMEIAFTWEKTYTGSNEIRVSLGELRGEWREVPVGPRLRPSGLAPLLDRDVPGVTSFLDNSQARAFGRFTGPGGVFRSLYTAGDSTASIPPPHQFPREGAERILGGHIMGQRIDNPIPWDANPLGAQEWTHFLNRHHFMRELVQSLAETGDERYAQALDSMVALWIEASPVPVDSNGGAGPSWETLSAAWRLREWLWVVGIAWQHRSFSAETRLRMLRSIWEHARHLMDHQGHPNNWIIVESAALALAGLCFSEFTEATLWTDTGVERLQTQFRRQFFEDGSHFEVSPLYHAICLHALLEVKRAAAAVKRRLPDEFDAPLEKSAEFLASLCRPDFSWPSLNDSGGATGDYCALTELAGEIYRRADLIWIGSRGSRGRAPDWASRAFPDAGIAVMRSHHGRDANCLVFRAGPPGASHVHGDALSLDVTALGSPRLVDPGITGYAPGALTDHYRSPSAHNMILIDGKAPERAGMSFRERTRAAGDDFSWTSDERLEVAVGVCRGPWGPMAEEVLAFRTVIFVKPDYWIVRDAVLGTGDHDITAFWQFFPGLVHADSRDSSVTFVDEQASCLELIPLPGSEDFQFDMTAGSLLPVRGWVSLNGSDRPATSCRYSIRQSLPATLLWVLLPFTARVRSGARATRQNREDGTIRVGIHFPGRHEDWFTFLPPEAANTGQQGLSHEWGSFRRSEPDDES